MSTMSYPSSYHMISTRPSAASLIDRVDVADLSEPLQWGPLQMTMRLFLTAVDNYALQSKQEIARRSNEHANQVKELENEKADIDREITAAREEEGRMLKTVEQERLQKQTLEASLARLHNSHTALKEKNFGLDGEVKRLGGEVISVREEKLRQKKALEERIKQDPVELEKLEDLLGWKVEGIKDTGVIMMSFSRIDPENSDKEFSLLLDVSGKAYSVTNCSLPLTTLNDIVADLNTDRDLTRFVKRAREALRATFPTSQTSTNLFNGIGGPGSVVVGGEGV